MKMYEAVKFQKLYTEIKDNKMPLRLAYKLNKLFQEVEKSTIFYQDSLNKLIEEYGKKDENGKFIPTETGDGIMIKEEDIEECGKKVQELNELEVVVDSIKFNLEELESLELTISEISFLMPFIEE